MRAQPPARDQGQHRDRAGEHEVDMAGDHVVQRRSGPVIRNVRELDAGQRLEPLHGEVLRAAEAGRRIVELVRMGLGEGDEAIERRERSLVADGQHIRQRRNDRDRHEGAWVVRDFPVEALVDHQHGRRGREQRVSVRLRLEDHLGADAAGRAGTVLDDKGLAEALRQLLGHDARDHVRRAAGGERHDHADRTIGVVVLRDGKRRRRAEQRHEHDRCADGSGHYRESSPP